jgi:hypothetical protein
MQKETFSLLIILTKFIFSYCKPMSMKKIQQYQLKEFESFHVTFLDLK